MSLAAKLPWTHRFAGGFPGLSSQPLPTDADAVDYLTRMAAADGAGVEVSVAVAVDAFVRDLKATPGLFDAIKASCILCGARTITGALVPLAGDAPTSNGFVSGDYSRTNGITGDGSSYLDSNYAYPTVLQNDCHVAAWVSGLPTSGVLAGYGDIIGSGTLISLAACRMYNNGGDTFLPSNTTASGLRAASRSDSSSFVYRRNETNETATIASTSVTHLDLAVFARQRHTLTPDNITDAAIGFYSIGTDIGSAGLAALDTAVTNLITAIGEAL